LGVRTGFQWRRHAKENARVRREARARFEMHAMHNRCVAKLKPRPRRVCRNADNEVCIRSSALRGSTRLGTRDGDAFGARGRERSNNDLPKRTPQRRRRTRKLTTGRQTRVKRNCPLSVALDQAESALNLREVGRKRGDSYAFKRVAPTHREASSTLPADE
jgi:hypothetical protein